MWLNLTVSQKIINIKPHQLQEKIPVLLTGKKEIKIWEAFTSIPNKGGHRLYALLESVFENILDTNIVCLENLAEIREYFELHVFLNTL